MRPRAACEPGEPLGNDLLCSGWLGKWETPTTPTRGHGKNILGGYWPSLIAAGLSSVSPVRARVYSAACARPATTWAIRARASLCSAASMVNCTPTWRWPM